MTGRRLARCFVDGNFKLKGKQRRPKAVELMPGWGPYVPEQEYKTHIANHVNEPEINTCESQHDALARAGTWSSPGYAVSGTVLVICSRHCIIRKNRAGDLQSGEKYPNVNFIIFAALVGITLLRIVIIYDVICQWSKHFRKRMAEFPEAMQIPGTTKVDVAIPGWYINGRGANCHNNFNLSYMEGAGRMVGKDIETTWAGTNPLGPSVREKGPAVCHNTLNNHCNGCNFRKIVGFRSLFVKHFLSNISIPKLPADILVDITNTIEPDSSKKSKNSKKSSKLMVPNGTITARNLFAIEYITVQGHSMTTAEFKVVYDALNQDTLKKYEQLSREKKKNAAAPK